ncbi:MAG: tRNA uridine-5-carboxymethylaminomethyl(34) synthesis GTPase MnmE [Acetatifactor sp.]|jgi:tRNA modification GTPase TrmE|nr:tRNA uridine-5-carboxymethylaminomethyl(34) synthesis GTPase MnmE [Acetatifactor sp.]MDE7045588.1 tRNA uridine-5-carboxymethylaminomethyl(34) synthesis GTPase MnmE [Acetatifactor sp.]
MYQTDTIAAIATGMTDSGIGIIRISGENAVLTGSRLFRTPSGKDILENVDSHTFYYGYIVDNVQDRSDDWKDLIIDEVMIVVMKAPRSYTGEDTVEIQCHGGVLVMQKILSAVIDAGARLAEPGEFSKRAFLNGKMDLSRAEAVMDVIHSQNEYALRSSVNQLKGGLSEKVKALRDQIIYEIAFIESALDDPEHISLEGYSDTLSEKLRDISVTLEKMIASSENGKLIREGINTVIVGKPNAGKSSLLNVLVGEERAIVTDIAGTTRDILQETVRFHGISLNITDTAGIRNTEDTVEKIGVERALQYVENSDLILYVVDISVELDENDRKIISVLNNKKVIVLLNKSDLSMVADEDHLKDILPDGAEVIRTSTMDNRGMDELEETVKDMFFSGQLKSNNEVVITNVRHKEALREALQSLRLVEKSIEDGMPEDFYSIDLMSAYASLGKIIGEEVDDDLVEEIFSKFCMGK